MVVDVRVLSASHMTTNAAAQRPEPTPSPLQGGRVLAGWARLMAGEMVSGDTWTSDPADVVV